MKKSGDAGKRERVLTVEGSGQKVRHGDVVRGLVKKTAIEVAGDRRYVACGECSVSVKVASRGRRRVYCPDCRKARDEKKIREWVKAHPEAVRKYEGARPNKAERLRRAQEKRAADPEAVREYHRAYRQANLEKVREYKRQARARAKARASKT